MLSRDEIGGFDGCANTDEIENQDVKTGVSLSVIQLCVGSVCIASNPILAVMLLGSGVSSLIYSCKVEDDKFSYRDYFASAATGATVAGVSNLVSSKSGNGVVSSIAGGAAGKVTSDVLGSVITNKPMPNIVKSSVVGGLTGGISSGVQYVVNDASNNLIESVIGGANNDSSLLIARTLAGSTSGSSASVASTMVSNFIEGKSPTDNVVESAVVGGMIGTMNGFSRGKTEKAFKETQEKLNQAEALHNSDVLPQLKQARKEWRESDDRYRENESAKIRSNNIDADIKYLHDNGYRLYKHLDGQGKNQGAHKSAQEAINVVNEGGLIEAKNAYKKLYINKPANARPLAVNPRTQAWRNLDTAIQKVSDSGRKIRTLQDQVSAFKNSALLPPAISKVNEQSRSSTITASMETFEVTTSVHKDAIKKLPKKRQSQSNIRLFAIRHTYAVNVMIAEEIFVNGGSTKEQSMAQNARPWVCKKQ